MLTLIGVDVSKLKRPIRKILPKVDSVFLLHNAWAILTSTNSGNHSAGSLHFADLAVDFDYAGPHPSIPEHRERLKEISITLAEKLPSCYQVVYEKDHIHVEYDPQ